MLDDSAGGGSGDGSVHARLLELAREMARDGRLVRTRRHKLARYRRCTTGTDAVTWLVFQRRAATRGEATQLGQALLLHGLLHHVTHEHNFEDAQYFYRFEIEN